LISDSILTQLPVPLLCISSTPRAPPRSAPASIATPSSSLVSATEWTLRIGERSVDQNPMAGIGNIGELSDIVAVQQIVEIVLPPAGPDAFVRGAFVYAGMLPQSSVRDYRDGRVKPNATNTVSRG
jgi:hypothetical protein